MATKRSSGPAKKAPRTRKKPAKVEPAVETQAVEAAPVEPMALLAVEPPAPAAKDVSVDEIRRRAYNYWVQGNPDPIANWFRAENELKQS
jgi:hypothetical protein